MTKEETSRKACDAHAGAPDPGCIRCGVLRGIAVALHALHEHDPFIGRTIGNGYVVRRLIGQGGMGSVYEAEQTSLDRRVAIKLLKTHLLRDELSTRRFYNEARAASRLNHPNSVAVFDFGATDDGVPFIVMEHLNGADLADLLAAEGAFEPERVCRIARAVLAALGEAHALGICHRDLKPENVILLSRHDASETIKVVDFGLARLAASSRLTEPNTVLGTPMYMAPEQFIGREMDGRADLYSLGVVMFELLTGRVPFDADHAIGLAHQHLTAAPPDPRSLASIDDELADVVLKALAKKPSERFESATAMAQAIGRLTELPVASRADRPRWGRQVAETLPTLDPVVEELDRTLLRFGAASTVVIAGRAGSGRTTTLSAFAARCVSAGHAVAMAESDARPGAASYAPLRQLVGGLLLDAGASDPERLALDPVGRAGYAELLRPVGLRGAPERSRAAAVAEALATMARRAASRARAGRVTLLLDDAGTYDELTWAALHRVAEFSSDVVSLVVVGDEDGLSERFSEAPRLVVGGEAVRLPLHVGLIRRLGLPAGAELPTIAECVAMSLDRADARARAALQAMAVFASCTTADVLAALGATDPRESLEAALATGLATRRDDGAEMHALVRELVAASIPAEVRRTLHDRALAWHTSRAAPVETRAHHAVWGGDGFSALLLLEQAGALALQRGDPSTSAYWFGRGLERARRELVLSGDDTFEGGVLTFTRKLAAALIEGDRLSEADGLLAEAEGSVGPMSAERARLRSLRARIVAKRSAPEAAALFEELLASDHVKRDTALGAECATGLAEARLAAGDARGAIAALEQAARALERLGASAADRAANALALAEALTRASEPPQRVRSEIDRALVFARRSGAKAMEARALTALARCHEVDRRSREALDAFERAAKLAEDAGDVDGLAALRDEIGEAHARAVVPSPQSGAPPTKRRVVLVVEDDVETQEVLWGCLTEQGYVVHAANSGRQALRLLGSIERPIAILVDLMMPVMDGWDLLAALRDHATYADIPITIVSAFADKAPEGVARLQKPIALADLLRVLAAAETRASAGAAAPQP